MTDLCTFRRRVLRSLLFAPGNNEVLSTKALRLPADAVILDLEDACPIDLKIGARNSVVARLLMPRQCLGYVRVNALTTEFGFADLCAVTRPGVDGIVLPKLESVEELHTADWLMSQLEREQGLPPGSIDLIPLIETAKGLSRIDSIASHPTRVRRFSFGAGDLTLDLGFAWTTGEAELTSYRTALVLASKAAGLERPIDTVWPRVRDPDGCRMSAERAHALGFGGKLCIHPDQLAIIHSAFSPSAAEIEHASRVVAAFEAAEAAGSASITVDGQLVDYPIADRARDVLRNRSAHCAS